MRDKNKAFSKTSGDCRGFWTAKSEKVIYRFLFYMSGFTMENQKNAPRLAGRGAGWTSREWLSSNRFRRRSSRMSRHHSHIRKGIE
jgi:hypothetical protein